MPRPERVTIPIEDALAHLDEEVTQLRAEQQAFEQFAERVATLTVAPSQPTTQSAVTSVTDGPAAATTRDVCTAYQDMVMALAHYDDVYGDSLADSLANEFGPNIATALTDEMTVTTLLQRHVCTAATQAAGERAAVLETLAAEQSALETAQDTLATLVQQAATQTGEPATPDEAALPTPSLDTLETRCDELATDRQHQLQTRSLSPHRDGHDIATYLYQDTDWTYPVLAAVARFSDRLRTS
jgi:hypothetical protein